MSDNSIGPWSVVNSYSKTIITISSAFLAFTGTFYSEIFGPETNGGAYDWLIACWILLLLACFAALFAVGRLTGFLDGERASKNQVLFGANASYFLLAGAVASFVIAVVLSDEKKGQYIDADEAIAISSTVATAIDTVSRRNIKLLSAVWVDSATVWRIKLLRGRSDTLDTTLHGGAGRVLRVKYDR